VGPATAAKLKELHLKVDVMPEKYLASEVAQAIADYESIENLNILLLRAEAANPELPEKLVELGGIVDDVACYKTVPETEDLTGSSARFEEVGADWITFTSSSTVQNFHQRFDLLKVRKAFPETRFASIGPETSKALKEIGFEPDLEASKHTIPGLVEALLKSPSKE
jgi:uroporphyrinogen III methyltransferase/synthase